MDKEKRPQSSMLSLLISVRFMFSMLLFFGYCLQYMLKINISIAIICMVNNTALTDIQNGHTQASNGSFFGYEKNVTIIETGDQCPGLEHHKQIDGPFLYDKATQGLILSAYFYGYTATQLLGGWLSYKFGGRLVLFASCLVAAISTILAPVCAKWHYVAFIISRLTSGLGHGMFWPAASSIWARWAPFNERSILLGFSSSGAWVGNIVALPLGGYLCVNGFDGGWGSIFYIFGGVCTVWCFLFLFLTNDSPEKHKFLSYDEKVYILNETKQSSGQNLKTPWLHFLTSKACWAIYFAHFASNSGIYLFLTQLPTYLKDVLKFDIKSNGLISALPYVAACLLNMIGSVISNTLITKGVMKRTNVRRLFGAIGLGIPVISMIGLSFVTCTQPLLAVVLLIIGISFTSMTWGSAHLVNINEIAGPFSGILFGISNTFASVPGIVAPFLVGVLTKNGTQKEWQIVFIIVSVIYVIGGVVWCLLCDANPQSWATGSRSKKVNDEIEADKDSFFMTEF